MTSASRPYFASYYRWLVASHALNVNLDGARVLDVGCDDASFLGRSAAAVRVGVDLAPRLLPHDGITVVRADARALPMIGRSFDCILAFDILEHIEEDHLVMRQLLRILEPGGTIWFSTPAVDTVLHPAFLHPYANRAFGHVRNGYTPEQVQALIPAGEDVTVDMFYWDEPWLRAGFVPLHLLDRLLPALADQCVRWIYRLDARRSDGRRGHLFGRIHRPR
jgi:SAM-dependent methyltransferase